MPCKPPPPDIGNATLKLLAVTHAQTVAPRIRELMASGMTLAQIADSLQRDGVRTPRGGKWRPETILRILELASGGAPAAQPGPAEPALTLYHVGPDYFPRRGRII
jgi:hypothetical protein